MHRYDAAFAREGCAANRLFADFVEPLRIAAFISQSRPNAYGNCLPNDRVLESEPDPNILIPMTRKTQRGRARSRPRQPPKFSIAIIGAGRVGFALGRALKNSGHSINVALTKTANPTRIARDLHTSAIAVGAKPLAELPQRYRELIQQSDVLIVATPDDLISQVANDLARLFQTSRFRGPKAVMHTSGALASDVMAAIRQREIAIGSIHPLISISDQTKRKQSFAGVQFSLEGDAAAIRIGKRLVRDLGGDSFVIETAKKPLYHATALMASPNATALFDVAIEMMRQCGMSSARARQILLPLI